VFVAESGTIPSKAKEKGSSIEQEGGAAMALLSRPERLYTTKEFDHWWENQGRATALQTVLDPDSARFLAWEAWRKGREQMTEAAASQRLQPDRR